MEDSICDLCAHPAPNRTYPAVDVVIDLGDDGPLHLSEGGWAACEDCARLIDADDRDGLADRCLVELQRRSGIPSAELLPMLRVILTAFWSSRR